MTKREQKSSVSKLVKFTVLALVGVALLMAVLLPGNDIVLYNPKGLIAQQQFHLMMFSTGLMLLIAVPTLTMLYFFAWKYRESNGKAVHSPQARHGKLFAASLWVIPIITLLVLTSVVWPVTHKLDPHKSIASDAKPITIQVIALRWKWLFIYPEQNIATVNYVQIPVGTPVQFQLTADEAPMNSFWIPHLGGQLYAMTGHDNRLNLMADTAGDYIGQAAEINGPGFAGMKFKAKASSQTDFDRWVEQVQQAPSQLDTAQYKRLLVPTESNPPAIYAKTDTTLYADVLAKYMASNGDHMKMEMGHQ